jgi:predicted ATPase with chaperone activity
MVTKKITNLWQSKSEKEWEECLSSYWGYVRNQLPKNFELEREMDVLHLEMVKALNPEEWYSFLREKYFRWKYTQPNRYVTTTNSLNRYLKEGKLDELFEIKQKLLDFDTSDIKCGLSAAKRIHGLGIPGSSGLLALLYPHAFGTVDQFVVKSLLEIPDLPEKEAIKKMNPMKLSLRNGVLLIELMRRKAAKNNRIFGGNRWTPRKIDMILWVCRTDL